MNAQKYVCIRIKTEQDGDRMWRTVNERVFRRASAYFSVYDCLRPCLFKLGGLKIFALCLGLWYSALGYNEKFIDLLSNKNIAFLNYLGHNTSSFPRSDSTGKKRSVPENSAAFMEAIFRAENFRIFWCLRPNCCSFPCETAGSRRDNSTIFRPGLLLLFSIDFCDFPTGNGNFSWSFRRSESSSWFMCNCEYQQEQSTKFVL